LFVQITNHFSFWAPHVEIFKTTPNVDRFQEICFCTFKTTTSVLRFNVPIMPSYLKFFSRLFWDTVNMDNVSKNWKIHQSQHFITTHVMKRQVKLATEVVIKNNQYLKKL
jgi:hypothetical protein